MGEKKTYRLFVDSGACQNGEGIARLTAEPAEYGDGVYADVPACPEVRMVRMPSSFA